MARRTRRRGGKARASAKGAPASVARRSGAAKRASASAEEVYRPFGPDFFARRLAAFVREACPDPSEGLPGLLLHLVDGEVIEVCHLNAVAPSWLSLYAYESSDRGGERRMRTVLVPYGSIVRITLTDPSAESAGVGFHVEHEPRVPAASPPA